MANRAFAGVLPLLLVSAALLLPGCSSLLDSQDEGPHPPVVSNLTVSPTTVRTGETLEKSFFFTDAGADVSYCITRDNQSGARYELSETDTDDEGNTVYNFPGTSGLVESSLQLEGSLIGVHHLEMWCVDKEGSISNILEAQITFTP